MDLNTATGVVAIRKAGYAAQNIRRSMPFWDTAENPNPEYWLYNAGDVPKYRTTPIEVPIFDENGDPTGETQTVDTAAMQKGITNLLQVGDLPSLGGIIQPVKYWRTGTDGTPKLKAPAQRTAADTAEADALAVRQRKAHVERRIAHHSRRTARRNAAQAARTAGEITQAELDGVNAED